jgi:hypothetical protein
MKEASKWSKEVLSEKGNAGFDYGMLHFSKKANLQKVVSIIEKLV